MLMRMCDRQYAYVYAFYDAHEYHIIISYTCMLSDTPTKTRARTHVQYKRRHALKRYEQYYMLVSAHV